MHASTGSSSWGRRLPPPVVVVSMAMPWPWPGPLSAMHWVRPRHGADGAAFATGRAQPAAARPSGEIRSGGNCFQTITMNPLGNLSCAGAEGTSGSPDTAWRAPPAKELVNSDLSVRALSLDATRHHLAPPEPRNLAYAKYFTVPINCA